MQINLSSDCDTTDHYLDPSSASSASNRHPQGHSALRPLAGRASDPSHDWSSPETTSRSIGKTASARQSRSNKRERVELLSVDKLLDLLDQEDEHFAASTSFDHHHHHRQAATVVRGDSPPWARSSSQSRIKSLHSDAIQIQSIPSFPCVELASAAVESIPADEDREGMARGEGVAAAEIIEVGERVGEQELQEQVNHDSLNGQYDTVRSRAKDDISLHCVSPC